MGDCYFIHAFRYFRDPKANLREPKTVIIRSEDLAEYVSKNANRLLNTTFGIWFYEGNLWNKTQLKEDLRNIINMIDELG